VRKVVTSYVCAVVPLIAVLFVVMLIHAPRAFATGYDSFAVHLSRVGPEFSDGRAGKGILDIVEMLVLALPLMGMLYTVGRVGRQVGAGAWSWSADHPLRRGGLAIATAAAAGLVAFVWWPHGEYRPIQPGEKGTVVSAVRSLPDVPSGRAALTPERRRELGGAPFRHETQTDPGEDSTETPGTTTSPETSTVPEETTDPATTTPDDATAPAPVTTTPDPTTTAPAPVTTTPVQPPAPATITPSP
jgi:putative peptide zinc metalloprotease protein